MRKMDEINLFIKKEKYILKNSFIIQNQTRTLEEVKTFLHLWMKCVI
jgi:hypothetical protein